MFADVISLQGGPLHRSSHNGASECHGSLCHDRAVQCLWGRLHLDALKSMVQVVWHDATLCISMHLYATLVSPCELLSHAKPVHKSKSFTRALSKRLVTLSVSLSLPKRAAARKSPFPMAQAQYCRFRMTWPNELGYPMQLSDRVGSLICSSLCAGFDSFKDMSLWPAFSGTSSSHQFDIVTLSIRHVFARARLGTWRHQTGSCLDMDGVGVKVPRWKHNRARFLGDVWGPDRQSVEHLGYVCLSVHWNMSPSPESVIHVWSHFLSFSTCSFQCQWVIVSRCLHRFHFCFCSMVLVHIQWILLLLLYIVGRDDSHRCTQAQKSHWYAISLNWAPFSPEKGRMRVDRNDLNTRTTVGICMTHRLKWEN